MNCLSRLLSFQFYSTNHPCFSQIAPFILTITCRNRLLIPSLLLKDWGVSKSGSFPLVGERMGFGPKEWLLPVISHRSSYWASRNKWWHAVLDILDVSPFTIGHRSHELLLFPTCSNGRSQLQFRSPFRRSIGSSKASSSQNTIYCFLLQFLVSSFFSLRLSSSFLHLLPLLPFTSTLPSIYPSIKCFRMQFLCKL
jgi:hypothetical protein